MKRAGIRIALGIAIVGMLTSEAWTWQDDAATTDESKACKNRISFRLKVSSADEGTAIADEDGKSFVVWGMPFMKLTVRHDKQEDCGKECCSGSSGTCTACTQATATASAAQAAPIRNANRQATVAVPLTEIKEGVQWIPATTADPSAAIHALATPSFRAVTLASAQGCCQGNCQGSCPTEINANPFVSQPGMIPPPCPPGIGCDKPMCDGNCPFAIHVKQGEVHVGMPLPPSCPACPACPTEPARQALPNFAMAPPMHDGLHQQLVEARVENARLQAQNQMLNALREQQMTHMQEKLDMQAEMMQAVVELKVAHLEEKIELATELARLQGTSELMGNLIEPTMKLHADNARLQAIVDGQHQQMAQTTAVKRIANQSKVNELIAKLKHVEQEKISLQQRLIELEKKYERMASERANQAASPSIR